jgi:hypothetical protein
MAGPGQPCHCGGVDTGIGMREARKLPRIQRRGPAGKCGCHGALGRAMPLQQLAARGRIAAGQHECQQAGGIGLVRGDVGGSDRRHADSVA